MQRYMYNNAALMLGRGGGVKNFFLLGGWALMKKLKNGHHIYILKCDLNHGIHDWRAPLPPVRQTIQYYVQYYTAPTRHGNRTNHKRPRKSMISLSFPILPNSLDLPHTVFCLPLYLIHPLSHQPYHRPQTLRQWRLKRKIFKKYYKEEEYEMS